MNISLAQLSPVARRIGVRPETLRAVAVVESGGRRPTAIRFESHLYHRYTGGKWTTVVPYTEGPYGYSRIASETDEAAFRRAYGYDRVEAVRATSWGAFQVLDPVRHGLADTPEEWLGRWQDEDPWTLSLELLEAWMVGWPAAMRDLHAAEGSAKYPQAWVDFARKYNGPRATEHGYHQRLAEAWREGE